MAGPDGVEPRTAEAWGWRERIIGTGEYTRQEWQPQGKGVGWLDETGLYLEPQAAYQAVQQFAQGGGITITAPTLSKRMEEAGLLQSTERERGTRTVRRTFAGARRKVIHLAPDVLFAPEPAKEDQNDEADAGAPVSEEGPNGATPAPVQVALLPRSVTGQVGGRAGQSLGRWTDQEDDPKTA